MNPQVKALFAALLFAVVVGSSTGATIWAMCLLEDAVRGWVSVWRFRRAYRAIVAQDARPTGDHDRLGGGR